MERQRAQSDRINKVLKPRNGGGPNCILIPAVTEYETTQNEGFDHFNIEQIWDRIEMHNGEDIKIGKE